MPETPLVKLSFLTLEQAGIDSYPKIAVVKHEMRASYATYCAVELQPHVDLIGFGEDESFCK
jgi:hypothetical protein